MAQIPKVIDLNVSYQPVDPETWQPRTYVSDRADSPDELNGVVPYDGKNFMPTSYGYRSYFGLTEAFTSRLPDKCQDVIFFQLATLENVAIALCEFGIYMKRAGADWFAVVRDIGGGAFDSEFLPGVDPNDPTTWPEVGPDDTEDEFPEMTRHYIWTHAIIENRLYCYRQGSDKVWTFSAGPEVINVPFPETESISIEVDDTITDGDLEPGEYEIAFATIRYQQSPLGHLEPVVSELKAIGFKTLVMPGSGFVIEATGMNPPADMLQIYYKVGVDEWHLQEVLLANSHSVDQIWKTKGEKVDQFPPDPQVREAGTPVANFPTFLNMAGQIGIFRAGNQLSFWDSANAIAHSSVLDMMDFEPSLETVASINTYTRIKGKITAVIPENDNFVVYATKSIVRAVRNSGSTGEWEVESVSQVAGISYPAQVTVGANEDEHYVYTSVGFFVVQQGKATPVMPEVFDRIREANKEIEDAVVSLKCIAGRFLFIQTGVGLFKPLKFDQTIVPMGGVPLGAIGWLETANTAWIRVKEQGFTVAGEMLWLRNYMRGEYTAGNAIEPRTTIRNNWTDEQVADLTNQDPELVAYRKWLEDVKGWRFIPVLAMQYQEYVPSHQVKTE